MVRRRAPGKNNDNVEIKSSIHRRHGFIELLVLNFTRRQSKAKQALLYPFRDRLSRNLRNLPKILPAVDHPPTYISCGQPSFNHPAAQVPSDSDILQYAFNIFPDPWSSRRPVEVREQ